MLSLTLSRHPSTPCPTVHSLAASLHRSDRALLLRYTLVGDIDALHIPAPGPARRADGLWQDTCFEVFMQTPEPPTGYYEFNFSPSGAWAAYRFDAYRQGMADLALAESPAIRLNRSAGRLELDASITLDGPPMLAETADWRFALSAVIKGRNGEISYWACAHPPGKPDFHHPDSFVPLSPGRGAF